MGHDDDDAGATCDLADAGATCATPLWDRLWLSYSSVARDQVCKAKKRETISFAGNGTASASGA